MSTQALSAQAADAAPRMLPAASRDSTVGQSLLSRSAVPDAAAALDDALRPLLSLASRATASAQMPLGQLRVLGALHEQPGLTLSALAAEIGSLPSTATRICNGLSQAGLVLRVPGRVDRRQVRHSLTAAGTMIIEQVRVLRQDQIRVALAYMVPSQAEALLVGLQALGQLVVAPPDLAVTTTTASPGSAPRDQRRT